MSVLDSDYPVKTWSRSTVADGDWLNKNTVQPLIDRTNILEADQADLLNSTNHLVDNLGNDMQLIAGDGIALIADQATRELNIAVNKSIMQVSNDTIQANIISPTSSPKYYDLNTNITENDIKYKAGDKITLENGRIFLDTGFYNINCFIKLTKNANFSLNDQIYIFRLYGSAGENQGVNISCLFNNTYNNTEDEGYFNMSFSLNITQRIKIDLYLSNSENIIASNILNTNILKNLTIMEA